MLSNIDETHHKRIYPIIQYAYSKHSDMTMRSVTGILKVNYKNYHDLKVIIAKLRSSNYTYLNMNLNSVYAYDYFMGNTNHSVPIHAAVLEIVTDLITLLTETNKTVPDDIFKYGLNTVINDVLELVKLDI
jgi:hypothetical protein